MLRYFEGHAAADARVSERLPLVHAMLQVLVSLIRFNIISTIGDLHDVAQVRARLTWFRLF